MNETGEQEEEEENRSRGLVDGDGLLFHDYYYFVQLLVCEFSQ